MTAIKTILDKDGIGTIHKNNKAVKCSVTNRKSRYVRYDPVSMEYMLCSKSGAIINKNQIVL